MNKKIFQIFLAVFISFLLWCSISLSGYYFTRIQVPVKVTNIPAGYSANPANPQTITMSMKCEGWRILMLAINKNNEFFVSAGFDSGYKKISLRNSLGENNWISGGMQILDVFPSTVSFKIEKIFYKKVEVKPRLKLSFKPHFGLVSAIRIFPDSVLVYGTKSLLKKIDYVYTEPEQLADLEGKTTERIRLARIEGAGYSVRDCSVLLNVQKIVDRVFTNIDVSVKNTPPGRQVILFPGSIGFVLRGGIDILGKMDAKEFHPYVDYNELISDSSNAVDPVLKTPDYVTIIKKEPSRLNYIIKKY